MITRNSGARVRRPLVNLLSLPEQPRILVVDNNSSDETVSVARSLGSRVEVIKLKRNLGAASRNIGAARINAPYLAFSDDDSWWAPGALRFAMKALDANPALGLVAARVLVGPEQRLDPSCEQMASSPFAQEAEPSAGIPITRFSAYGAIMRRSAFLQTGGFEPRLGVGGEEQVVALQLLRRGWEMRYMDHIVAYHHPSPVRDDARRRAHEARNALWSAWLRRPARSAIAVTWRMLRASLRDSARLRGLLEAASGMAWVLSNRDPIPDAVDEQVQQAEANLTRSGPFR